MHKLEYPCLIDIIAAAKQPLVLDFPRYEEFYEAKPHAQDAIVTLLFGIELGVYEWFTPGLFRDLLFIERRLATWDFRLRLAVKEVIYRVGKWWRRWAEESEEVKECGSEKKGGKLMRWMGKVVRAVKKVF